MEKIWLSNGCDFDEDFFKKYPRESQSGIMMDILKKMIENALKQKVKTMRIKIEAEIEQ